MTTGNKLFDLLKQWVEYEPEPNLAKVRARFVRKVRTMKWNWLAEVISILFFGGCLCTLVVLLFIVCKGCW